MRGRIVIVDDEPITRLDIKDILTDAGYEVSGEAADGFEAVEICRNVKPDLVLMDIQIYKKLRRLSMDRRSKMSEIAELIIMDSE